MNKTVRQWNLLAGTNRALLEEPVDPDTVEASVRVDGIRFKCYQLSWYDFTFLRERYTGRMPEGIVTGYALQPGNDKIHFWPVPIETMEITLKYAPMPERRVKARRTA